MKRQEKSTEKIAWKNEMIDMDGGRNREEGREGTNGGNEGQVDIQGRTKARRDK